MKSHHNYDQPFLTSPLLSIYLYATTHTDESVYIISGGCLQQPWHTSIIAQYKDDNWSIAGHLRQPRSSHGAIIVNGMTMIIGGDPQEIHKGST